MVSVTANVAVLLGLVLVAYELRQNTQQLKVQLEWQVNQKIFENNRDLLGDSLPSVLAKSVTDPDNLDFEEFFVASSYILNLLNVWEDKYFMYKEGLIDQSDWQRPVDEEIGFTLGNAYAQAFWHSVKGVFEPELADYIDSRLPEVGENQTYQWWLDMKSTLSERPAAAPE